MTDFIFGMLHLLVTAGTTAAFVVAFTRAIGVFETNARLFREAQAAVSYVYMDDDDDAVGGSGSGSDSGGTSDDGDEDEDDGDDGEGEDEGADDASESDGEEKAENDIIDVRSVPSGASGTGSGSGVVVSTAAVVPPNPGTEEAAAQVAWWG